ncbi:hypothetical protein LKR43_07655 [Pusillimonas sp. MFBS29]|uniref:2-amino-5-chloromuconate deaminase CnbZ n=1 Tax=Pusillimonas sp. MFBS29 TaxID=2886690 RepID=UPI001D0FC822|nr:hypothetical protein [Pusillimonas sp. MFBS29]MCC2596213.1 hypothetical protein [Pusillimonas sp. MFBS29]
MVEAIVFDAGGYRFVPSGVLQYSGGVAAQPGYTIRRVVFSRPVPVKEGFKRIENILRAEGRPLTAFCACELRSPAPLSETGFSTFNTDYVQTLKDWGIYDGVHNPIARSNVCPEIDPPAEPCFYAFSYTVPCDTEENTYVIAGSSEVPEGKGNYKDHLVRYQDISPEGMHEKARWVLAEMERRQAVLGYTWRDSTAAQLYIVHNPHPFLAEEFAKRGAMRFGLTWHFVRPPVVDMEFEMDCRRVLNERIELIEA